MKFGFSEAFEFPSQAELVIFRLSALGQSHYTSTRPVKIPSSRHSKAKRGLLPRPEQTCGAIMICCDRLQGGARGDKSRFQFQFLRHPIASKPELLASTRHFRARPHSKATARDRPFLFRRFQCALRCIAKGATPTRRKMSVIGHAARGETFCRMQEFVILQNMKWWTIDRGRFVFAPSPKGAKNGGSAAFQRTRAADAPGLIFVPHPRNRGLLNRTPTRLP